MNTVLPTDRATAAEPVVAALRDGIASTEQLIWDAEQALRALQDRFVDPGELWNLKRLVDKLETQQ